jgi:hypothetical protein
VADWWDRFTTGLGDMLIAPQSFGSLMPPPTDPAQRQAMIANGLMTLGTAITQGARTRSPVMESVGQGWQQIQRQGQERAQQQLQTGLLMGKLGEQQRRNQTREVLKKQAPPGYTPETWGAFVDSVDGPALLKVHQQAQADARAAAAYGGPAWLPGGGGGSAPGSYDARVARVESPDEVMPQGKAIRDAAPRNTRAADINIVFAFAKLLDPTSVVREGEQLSISRTGGVWDTIKGYAEKLNGGGMLTPEIRAAIQREAEDRFTTYRDQYAAAHDEFRGYFKEAGLDPAKVFKVPAALEPYQEKPVGQPPITKGTRAQNPQTGQEILWDGTQWLDVKTLKPVAPEPVTPTMPTR